ncbi:hypothetical protein [Umezawaea sp. NPDC059074]|uniref:hypothetical protein n=1 Tax=Umezawaea sp. NPDC059074 TaxID=3346716 RepID=UPI0036A65524
MVEANDSDSEMRFCAEFASLLRQRGVSVRTAAAKTHWGKSTIANAGRGPGLPNRALVVDVLKAVDVPAEAVQAWLERYDALALLRSFDTAERVDVSELQNPVTSTARRLRPRRHLLVWIIGAVVLGAITVTVVATVLADADSGTDHQTPDSATALQGRPHATVVVQNKVAIGAAELVEDDSPSYLSERPVRRCANTGCKLDGTDLGTGDTITAVCHLQGDLLTNADVSSPGIKQNPNVAASALWYEVIWPDGRRGYISEVYLAPAYRGGLTLPPC